MTRVKGNILRSDWELHKVSDGYAPVPEDIYMEHIPKTAVRCEAMVKKSFFADRVGVIIDLDPALLGKTVEVIIIEKEK